MSAVKFENRNKITVKGRHAGFSLIELVIVVVIIAIIGAIAVPKMSRGAAGANDAALSQDLSTLRGALDLFATENGGNYPAAADMPNALIGWSNGSGAVTTVKGTAGYIYGPYLRTVPPMPVGTANKGSATFVTGTTATPPGAAGTSGWYYNTSTFEIKANAGTTEKDVANVNYNAY